MKDSSGGLTLLNFCQETMINTNSCFFLLPVSQLPCDLEAFQMPLCFFRGSFPCRPIESRNQDRFVDDHRMDEENQGLSRKDGSKGGPS